MITPRNIARHELAGLPCSVVGSSDEGRVGAEGVVVDETTHTLVLASEDGGNVTVPKTEATFEFELPDATVHVEGGAIDGRPAERARGV